MKSAMTSEEMAQEIGSRRRALGFSTAQLAAALGCSRKHILTMESRQVPDKPGVDGNEYAQRVLLYHVFQLQRGKYHWTLNQ